MGLLAFFCSVGCPQDSFLIYPFIQIDAVASGSVFIEILFSCIKF